MQFTKYSEKNYCKVLVSKNCHNFFDCFICCFYIDRECFLRDWSCNFVTFWKRNIFVCRIHPLCQRKNFLCFIANQEIHKCFCTFSVWCIIQNACSFYLNCMSLFKNCGNVTVCVIIFNMACRACSITDY